MDNIISLLDIAFVAYLYDASNVCLKFDIMKVKPHWFFNTQNEKNNSANITLESNVTWENPKPVHIKFVQAYHSRHAPMNSVYSYIIKRGYLFFGKDQIYFVACVQNINNFTSADIVNTCNEIFLVY